MDTDVTTEENLTYVFSMYSDINIQAAIKQHTLTPALAVWLLLPTDHSYAASLNPEFASCVTKKMTRVNM